LAAQLFAVPIAAISFIDKDRQWFKASVGLDVTETPRDQSFCAHAIMNPSEVLYVPDASKDPRFADNPLVTGSMSLRFYAGAPIFGPSGHPMGTLCVIDNQPREVSSGALEQLRQLAVGVGVAIRLHSSVQELRKLTVTDALTGLVNRGGFNQQLKALLTPEPGEPAPSVGIVFMDLDGFKGINDTLGHTAGDRALQEVAKRLIDVTRTSDTVVRFGGDEFCVLVADFKDAAGLHNLADRIHAVLAEPFVLERQAVKLRTSIGIAFCRSGAESPDSLVKRADTALYEAKRAGRGTTRVATAAGLELEAPHAAAKLAVQEAYTLALQPVFDRDRTKLVGFEALAQCAGPAGPGLTPNPFVPHDEVAGIAAERNRWALNEACRILSGWPAHLTIASRLSAANFTSTTLVAEISTALNRHRVEAGRLKLEINEKALIREPAGIPAIIGQLRSLGVQVVLNDFGAGHASMAYLRDYAFTGLKIDGSFTALIATDARSLAFVRAIIDMAAALGVETIAEGVETREQLRLLRQSRIGSVQGNLLGAPMTETAARDLIHACLRTRPSLIA
jgi:diguanylate cyclase (GGDEF)-like protein